MKYEAKDKLASSSPFAYREVRHQNLCFGCNTTVWVCLRVRVLRQEFSQNEMPFIY